MLRSIGKFVDLPKHGIGQGHRFKLILGRSSKETNKNKANEQNINKQICAHAQTNTTF